MPHRPSPSRPAPDSGEESGARLARRLRPLVADRGACAEALVLEGAELIRAWVLEQEVGWTWEQAGAELERGLLAFEEDQGWRGPCALFLDALRAAWRAGAEGAHAPRELLAEELGLWSGEAVAATDGCARWGGRPLGEGRRLPSRAELAAKAARLLDPGESVLVAAPSETVALALEAARAAGRAPRVVLGEAAPLLDGERLARRLVRSGLEVELAPDGALHSALRRVDRLWLGTEALGPQGVLARVGTRALLEEAERRELPRACLATSDKLVPGGELSLPAWCAREPHWLCEEPPEGLDVASQLYELVPLTLLPRLVTELGSEGFAQLSLRALRLERAPRCGAPLPRPRPAPSAGGPGSASSRAPLAARAPADSERLE